MLSLKTVSVRDDGCFSVVLWNGRPFAVSVERTFDDYRTVLVNGFYHCTRDFYHKGGYETFLIVVPGHSRVLLHKGNIEDHSEACVLLGENFGGFNRDKKSYSSTAGADDQTAVLASGEAFAEFMSLTKGLKEFMMEVTGR